MSSLTIDEKIEKIDALFDGLEVAFSRKYDEDKMLSTVDAYSPKFPGIVFTGYSKAHKDDVDFATELTGLNIAELKALKKLYKHVATQSGEFGELGQLAYEDTVEVLSEYIESKDKFFRQVEKNRANGGRTPTVFEDLGDLLKDVPLAKKEEIFAQIYTGVIEEQQRIKAEVEKTNPKGESK